MIPTNRPIARIDMNDRVYKTKREKYKAVIEEIEKMVQAGRPVLVGTTSVEISEMLSKMLTLRKDQHNVLNAKLHQKEAEIVAKAGQSSTVTIATNMAGRGTDIKLSAEVKAAGGLAIIGTERHESSCRPSVAWSCRTSGDPGSSVFFVSLEDDLMRLFSSDHIATVMDKLGFKEGEMIEHKMISNSIERAQKKVEENNFGIRKRLLEYDDVMNKQRTVVLHQTSSCTYGRTYRNGYCGYDLERCYNAITATDLWWCQDGNSSGILAMEAPFTEEDFRSRRKNDLAEQTFREAMALFKRKTERMAQIANPVIKQVYEGSGTHVWEYHDTYYRWQAYVQHFSKFESCIRKRIKRNCEVVEKSYLVAYNWRCMERKLAWTGWTETFCTERKLWAERSLLIFKLESVNLFDNMVNKINNNTISVLMRGQIPVQEPEQVREAAPEPQAPRQQYREEKSRIWLIQTREAAGRDTREQSKSLIAQKNSRSQWPMSLWQRLKT